MNDQKHDISQRQAALIAGIAFLIMTVAAGFAYGFVLNKLVVPDNPALTAAQIRESVQLFRFALLGFVIVLICDVVVAWALYLFLKPVNKSLSLLTAWLRLVYGALLGAVVLQLVFIVLLADQAPYLTAFSQEQLDAWVHLLISSFNNGWAVGLIIFGLHLALLGSLAVFSGYIPKFLGFLLIFAGLLYVVVNLTQLVVPAYQAYKVSVETVLSLPMALGELAFAFWLLIRGGKK